MSALITLTNLGFAWPGQAELLDIPSFHLERGESLFLKGPSGSGKTTLLGLLGGVQKPGRGSIRLLGEDLEKLSAARRDHFRVDHTGYIFQQFNLVNRLSVLDNVLLGFLGRMPRWRGSLGLFSAEQKRQALEALARVGLADFAGQRASTLSGGQQQRVAIARALTQKAEVILADEPIASLDPESARKVMDILADINRHDGKTVVVTLHQVDYALRYCPRAVALKGGRILFDGSSEHLSEGFLNELYGAEGDTPLLFSDRARRGAESQPELTLARA
ncbi:phosphonate ABC transporter ATP-binding protein [Pseudomonas aeruginosa]|nr:phosphonate ABC transporter ATP-binding protein [Pseudomonas aeruginosa]MCR3822411.1 phosphonate ABC transporter ATP-binding protein [Pseudomonas aeruginosa]